MYCDSIIMFVSRSEKALNANCAALDGETG